ncbi:MAG: HTH-type transcriptional activator IlvY [Pseudomonadales bacterium]|jgi:LysR family positive regulator for ilvC|tara:strand:+ start:1791 stop:2696 length:906 start_codon:yes stop_codon:yes gene_type:complete
MKSYNKRFVMDTHTLEIYLGLCRNLHFGRTSDEFHLSASALSRLVQKLEGELSQTLFIRDNRTVELTPQGEILRVFAQETLQQLAQVKTQMGEASELLSGSFRLFASVTASQTILPKVLTQFRLDYPEIHIQLDTGYAVDALQSLHEGCDVVVAALSKTASEGFAKKIITSTPILTVAPVANQFFTESIIDWSKVPLVLPAFGQVRDNIDAWFRENKIKPDIYSEVSGNEAILSLVALGCGVGFVPGLVMDNSPLIDQIEIVPQGPNPEEFHVGFCTTDRHLSRSPIVRAFWTSINAELVS